MSLVLNESLVLAKTRSQDLSSVLRLNCWGSGIKDVSLVRKLVNVEVIGLSCNEITSLEDFAYCPKLRELILRKNDIKSIAEVAHLQSLPKLTNLWLGDNPCAENTYNYRKVVLKALPNLTVLDNVPVTREELQEIEELGNDIYEEVPYAESGSNPAPAPAPVPATTPGAAANNPPETPVSSNGGQEPPTYSSAEQSINETSYYQPNDTIHDISIATTRSNVYPQSRCLSLQGSVTTLNGSGAGNVQGWSINHNNNLLPKGGKSRNGNILSAVLCLVKELDYVSCEVVQTALHCRMEETSQ